MSTTADRTAFAPRLHHVGISVADLEATVGWYREKLGFETLYRFELPDFGMKVAFLGLGDFRVEVFEIEGASPLPDHAREALTDLGVHGVKHVALAVDDLDGAMAELEDRGVEFATEVMEVTDSGGERYAFFRDNNGFLIELYGPIAAHERATYERAGGTPGEGAS